MRDHSRADYLHNLLLPPETRDTHLVLRRFHLELTDIVRRAKEPQLAEIRLQWWADGVLGLRASELSSHPTGSALLRYVEVVPTARDALAAKVEAHAAELYADAPHDRHAFEELAGSTRSVLLQLTAARHGEASEWTTASGHAGVAELVAERLSNLPWYRRKGFVPLPLDLLADDGMTPEVWLADDAEQAIPVRSFAAYGLEHLAKARVALPERPRRRVFAKLGLYATILRRAVSDPDRVLRSGVEIGPLRTQWLLWRG